MHEKHAALFTSVNLLLGVGPLILPMPFFDAGIGLSIIWMIIVLLLSYNSAMFINESMGKVRQHDYNLKKEESLISGISEEEDLFSVDEDQVEHKSYDHSEQFAILYGQKWKYFPSMCVTIYLTCTSISKCIMTGNTLSKVFSDAIEGSSIFSSFSFWLLIFFVFGAVFSFRSIDKTKPMQFIIISVRAISIILMIGGALYLIIKDGMKNLTPKGKGAFNVDSFVQLFSNSVFALMFHHSLPGIMEKLKNTEDVRYVIKYAFLISGLILIIIPLTGCMAFGEDLGTGKGLKYYNFDFKGKVDAAYWVVSFYVFLNIAAFSVYIIVIRSNILKMIKPSVDPQKLSKQTLISSFLILVFILAISSLLQDQIQIVLDFNGGILGTVIIFFIPSLEVWKARQKIHKEGQPQNYLRFLPIIIGAIGFLFLIFNMYDIIRKNFLHQASYI